MKHRHLIALAGAAAIIAAPSALATPTITATVNWSNSFLVGNGLQSVVISITGFSPGTAIRGIKGTAAHPWKVDVMMDGDLFNLDTVNNPDPKLPPLFEDGAYAARSNNAALNAATANTAQWDSGLIGSTNAQSNPNLLGFPSGNDCDEDVAQFALFTDGEDEDSIAQMSWMSTAPDGIPVGEATNFRVLRVTWYVNSHLWIHFALVMTTGEEIPMSLIVGIGVVGACCLPNGDCYTTQNGPACENQGGIFHAGEACHLACPPTPCPADLAPQCGDDVVNVADLLAVIGAWGPCSNPNDCPADIAPPGPPAGDDAVNVEDLLGVINAWGACPP